MDGVEVRNGYFKKTSVVLDECYPDAPVVEIRNPTNDGWVGTIEYSRDGGLTYAPYRCPSCNGRTADGAIFYVDGDSNMAHTWGGNQCLRGVRCQLAQDTVGPPPATSGALLLVLLVSSPAPAGERPQIRKPGWSLIFGIPPWMLPKSVNRRYAGVGLQHLELSSFKS